MKHPDLERNIDAAARLICSGKLVAFPTETVYGLGGDATNPNAIASIYEVKGRPSFNPLIIHVPSIDIAEKLVKFSEQSKALAEHFCGFLHQTSTFVENRWTSKKVENR